MPPKKVDLLSIFGECFIIYAWNMSSFLLSCARNINVRFLDYAILHIDYWILTEILNNFCFAIKYCGNDNLS